MLRISSNNLERDTKVKTMKEFHLNSKTSEFHENGIFGSVPKFLYFLLRWSGFVEESDIKASHRVSSRILDILLFVTCVDVCISIVISSEMVDQVLLASYLSCHIVSAVVWYEMRFKRKLITSLLQNIGIVNSSFYVKVINFLVFINCCIIFLLPVFLINRVIDRDTLKFFFYGYDLEIGWLITILGMLKFFLNYILYPSTTNIVVLFYISLCWHCSMFINNLANETARYTPEEFKRHKQLDILKNKAKIGKVLQNIQTIFSLPMFLIIVANFLICSSILAGSLIKIKFDEDNIVFIFYFLNAILCVVTSVWVAGSIPIAISRFKEVFHQTTHDRLLYHHTTEELHLKTDLFHEPDFVLTGCNIISYRRSTILALIGTLLTYTVLVLSTHESYTTCK
ncbi:uncharacterized protein TNIN_11311 [Trichonephila inaurata madagascariensis]|uniref:Gustatory receptor n=1 Tax=Trichonephila inaurata madagascariensis TaxID=2747483 RepID=A0A8X7BXT6_9ARAC|nr:uncharacterized protein TNIN_11311 [Trichonephila inaurata madagascariensis]